MAEDGPSSSDLGATPQDEVRNVALQELPDFDEDLEVRGDLEPVSSLMPRAASELFDVRKGRALTMLRGHVLLSHLGTRWPC